MLRTVVLVEGHCYEISTGGAQRGQEVYLHGSATLDHDYRRKEQKGKFKQPGEPTRARREPRKSAAERVVLR
jgi:hypothetical protein